MTDPTADACRCRPGYKCAACDQADREAAIHDAERRRVERLLNDENDD